MSDEDLLEPNPESRFHTWMTALRRGRAVWNGAASGVVLLTVGILFGYFASTASTASDTPRPGLVTVPVSYGTLENTVTLRGQVGYADSLEVNIDVSSLPGPAVVTGHLPTLGTQLDRLSVALEVAGRPMVVLPGALGAYRTLEFGTTGPDVTQFKQAMRDIGIDAGDPANATFDEVASRAVTELFAQAGYAPPAIEEGEAEAVTAARAAMQSAEDAVASAQNDLAKALSGPSSVDLAAADNTLRSAQRALDAAKSAQPSDPNQVADLEDALRLAEIERAALVAQPEASAERLAVTTATRAVTQARDELTVATQKALPSLPASEVLYVPQLPARVDKVDAKLGVVLEGPAMTISGATLGLSGSIDTGDAKLIEVGDHASFELADGSSHGATVAAITPGSDAAARPTVALTPDPLTAEQATQLAGQNVNVVVPVGATEGAVLSVPVAALSAGPGGETRVTVVDGDPREGENAATRLVVVDTGLAAEGKVEVRPKNGDLVENDLVVVEQ